MFMNRLTLTGVLGARAEKKFTRDGNPYPILAIRNEALVEG